MLCSKHFDDSSFTNSARIRLHNFAIPTGTQDLMVLVLEPSLPVQVPTTANPTTSLPVQVPTICEPTTDSLKMLVLEPSLPVQVPTTANPTTSLPVQVPTICEPTTDSLKMPRTKGILKELDLSKSLELTPKKLKLYKRCRRNLSEIMRLRKKIKKQPRALFKTLTTNSNVQSLMDKNISGPFALLLQSQLQNTPRKLTGRRWSIDDKVMALSIYKRSTGCYRLLRRLFCLPSEGTLKALLNRIPMKCGINSQIFKTIKDITKNREPEENLCILAFDEMSIRKHLQYNSKQDVIDGYQDHGNQGRTMEPATHALLFMAIGIRKKWKQPLAFYFSGDCVTADRLSVLIKEVLDASFQAGLNVTATVSDNFGVNIKALNSLGSSVAQPYFEFKGHEIVTIIDPPHLIKCFRNNLLKYDIKCPQVLQIDGKSIPGVAKNACKDCEQ
ncbi:unnamed protein product [Parnassius apollo]|uniref:(apollo) hypothetical protein n=1 Tax=Parnassius apollo TaxID=110799 RepID=A0A8S3X376_PARAO|nr:unnamed protein product [Parnassius apollo]